MNEAFNPAWAILMLVLVVASVPLSVWVIKRMPGWRIKANTSMKIEESLSLGPREKLIVVRVEGRRLLVGATGQSINTLLELGDAPIDRVNPGQADSVTSSGGFASHLEQAQDGR